MKIWERKLITWDFSMKLILRKKYIDIKYPKNTRSGNGYSNDMVSLGCWTRDSLVELGPTFIKLGQTFSTRTDILPLEITSELEKLQDNVTPIDKNDIINTLSQEMNNMLLFESFDYSPYKSASLGQVHRAVLSSGVKVAVKIQRPGVRELIINDLAILVELIDFLEFIRVPIGQSVKSVFLQTKEKIIEEVDYRVEANNAKLFMEHFKDNSDVVVPRVYFSKSTSKVLIMEWVPGIKITDIVRLKENNIDTTTLSYRFVNLFIKQIVDYGFFHADPHPGNVAVSRQGKIILYDYGLVVKIPDQIKQRSSEIITAIIQKNTNRLVDIFIELGIIIPNTINKYEIVLFFGNIINYIENNINVDNSDYQEQILKKLSEDKPFLLPSSFIFLGKTIGIVEGISKQLNPDFKYIDYIQPYFQENINMPINASEIVDNIGKSALEMPSKIKDISDTINNVSLNTYYSDIRMKNSIDSLYNLLIINILVFYFVIFQSSLHH